MTIQEAGGASPEELLRLFDRQLRRDAISWDPEVRVERDERTTIWLGPDWGAVLWSELDEESADAEIARALVRLRAGGGEVEWKLYGHDGPADLPRRLVAAGLEPDAEEAVLVADLAGLELEPVLPDGVELRVASSAEELAHFGGLAATLGRALEREPPAALGVLCLAGGELVCSARVELNEGSDFAGLWGGETVPEWRGRGLYRATVALRARLARERGYRYLQVDALPTSAPILRRLGFLQLTTTTPYTPAAGADGRAARPAAAMKRASSRPSG